MFAKCNDYFIWNDITTKSILSYLNEAPFVTSQKSLCNLSLKSEAGEVDKDDIVSILQLCALHKETFFTSFVIVNTDNGYKLCAHGNDCYQVYSQSKLLVSLLKRIVLERCICYQTILTIIKNPKAL